jgi:hypothetical protein
MPRAGRIVAAVVLTVATLAGCSGRGSPPAPVSAALAHYGELVKRFPKPDVPQNSSPEDLSAAMGEYIAKNNQYFDELIKAAPAEIKPDVEKAITVLRRAPAGGVEAYDQLDTRKADKFEEQRCPPPR